MGQSVYRLPFCDGTCAITLQLLKEKIIHISSAETLAGKGLQKNKR
jgi:hypothetical protein